MLPVAALLVVALIAGITVVAVVVGDDQSKDSAGRCQRRISPDIDRVAVGETVPNFSLPDLDGQCVRLSRFRGQPLIVNFWASWCHPCRVEFPLLEAARSRYADDGVEVLGIIHDDIESDARGFAEEQGAEWPLLFDEDDTVSNLFGVTQIPQTFFISPDGTLVSHVYGLTSPRDLNAEIKRLLKR